MIERGLYYLKQSYSDVIRAAGGEWHDSKHRPVVCLLRSSENPSIYWAIPMGKYNHRDKKQLERLRWYLSLPQKDLRSCYYHVGRTTAKSIFFISDTVPITEEYILESHLGPDGRHFIIKNPKLIAELERKLLRLLSVENADHNHFRQHITDIKDYLLWKEKQDR